MVTPDIRTAAVASRKEPNRAAAVTTRSRTEERKACSSSPRATRRGEKVPAAVGTVGDRFGLPDDRPLGGKGTGRGPGETEASASGAGLLRRDFGGLLFEEQLESPLRESLSRDRGDLLEGAEIDLQTRPLVPEGPFGDDLGPLSSEVVELPKFLGRESDRYHDSPPPEVMTRATGGFPIPTSPANKTTHKPRTNLEFRNSSQRCLHHVSGLG